MFKRIIVSCLFVMFLIALVLKIQGIEQIAFGKSYYNFFNNVAIKLSEWKDFKIPTIPTIDMPNEPGFFAVVLGAVVWIANNLFSFFNCIIYVFNLIIEMNKFIFAIFDILFTSSSFFAA